MSVRLGERCQGISRNQGCQVAPKFLLVIGHDRDIREVHSCQTHVPFLLNKCLTGQRWVTVRYLHSVKARGGHSRIVRHGHAAVPGGPLIAVNRHNWDTWTAICLRCHAFSQPRARISIATADILEHHSLRHDLSMAVAS